MKIYDTNLNKGPFTLPVYYLGKMWGSNPNTNDLVAVGLIPYINPVVDYTTQKLGDIQVDTNTCTHIVVDLTEEEIQSNFESRKQTAIDAIQIQVLDATAQSHGYDSVDSSVKYQDGSNQLWSDESYALVSWTIEVWSKCHEILNKVTDGEIPEPTIDELIEQMPVMVWPSEVV